MSKEIDIPLAKAVAEVAAGEIEEISKELDKNKDAFISSQAGEVNFAREWILSQQRTNKFKSILIFVLLGLLGLTNFLWLVFTEPVEPVYQRSVFEWNDGNWDGNNNTINHLDD